MTFFCFENLSFSFFNYILKFSEVRFTQPSVALTAVEREDHVLCSSPSGEAQFERGSVSLLPPWELLWLWDLPPSKSFQDWKNTNAMRCV